MRWRLRVQFVVVAVIAAHFALARFDPHLATFVAGLSASTFSMRVARSWQYSAPAAAAIGISGALVVSSVFLTVLTAAHAWAPVSTSSMPIYGEGLQVVPQVFLRAFDGMICGLAVGLPVVFAYGVRYLSRRLMGVQPARAHRPTRRRSRANLTFTVLMAALSACLAFAMYPYPMCIIAASMSVICLMAILVRVGWYVPCLVAGVCVRLLFVQMARLSSFEWQMYVTVTAVSLGAIAGCCFGLAIDSAERKANSVISNQ